MKYFFCHIPFGRKEVYAKEVMKASLERLARLIRVCGFLLQMKVYLFWENLNVYVVTASEGCRVCCGF